MLSFASNSFKRSMNMKVLVVGRLNALCSTPKRSNFRLNEKFGVSAKDTRARAAGYSHILLNSETCSLQLL